MLTKLALQNFKAWEKCAIELGRITVLIGPNGSGKSSLLQALGLLKQSRNQETLVWNGPYESLGRFEDVVSHGASRRRVEFQLSLKNEVPTNTEDISESYECRYRYSFDSFGPVEHTTEYHFPRSNSIISRYDFQKSQGRVDAFPQGLIESSSVEPGEAVAVPFLRNVLLCQPLRPIRRLRDVVSRQLGNTFVVKTQRIVSKDSYSSKPAGADFTESGDVASFIAYNDEPRLALSDWLSRIFDEDIELSARFLPDSRIALELRRRESTNIAHEGAGLQSSLWPLAQIAAAPAGSLIALEEPEIHLHPKAQAQLAQTLTEIARSEDKQILVTSQSEHILMSFLTEAVKSSTSPDDFRVYYCSSRNRVAEIEELRLDPNGGLDGGLKGFFESSFDETQRYLEALTARNTG